MQNGYKTSLHRPSVDGFKVDNTSLPISVEVEATEACPRYCAVSLKNCEVKESPEWLKDRLNISGLRPINNIVDITIYIRMAFGQPLHCFDADMITGGKIVVKKDTTLVKEGEPIPANVAAMLPKLEILPMIVGLDLRAAYEDGTIYHRDVLNIPDDYYATMFATAARNAIGLGVAIGFPTKDTIIPLITKAFREAMGLLISAAIPIKDNIKMLLAKADSQMLSIASAANYTDGSIGARLSAAASAAPAAPAEEAKASAAPVEEEEEVSEDEAAAGLSALFG